MHFLMATYSINAREHILKELKECVRQGKRAYLIVPEQFTMQTDIRLFEALDVEVLMDIKIKSFSSLAREVLGRLGGLKMPYIHEGGRRMLVQYLLSQYKNDLPLYGKGFAQPGISEKIVETLSDYRKLDLTAEKLLALLEAEDVPALLAEKIKDMATILKGYRDILGETHLDSESRLSLLAEKIPGATWFKDTDIYIDGFHSLSQMELEVVKALEDVGANVYVSMVLPEKALGNTTGWWTYHGAMATSMQFYESLVQQGLQGKVIDVDVDKDKLQKVLTFLTQSLFLYEDVSYTEAQEVVALWKAPYPLMEVQYIAGYIRKMVLEKKYRYRDFHITTNQPATYFPLFERVFRQYELPVFIDDRKSMTSHYLVQFMLRTLEMVASHFSYPVVFSCLKTGLSLMSEEEVTAFDYFARVKHLRGEMYFKEKYFILSEEQVFSKKMEGLRDRQPLAWKGFETFKAVFKPLQEDLMAAVTVKDYVTVLYHFMTRPELLDCFYRDNEEKNNAQQELDAQILEHIVALFDQLVETIGEMPITLEQFVHIIKEGVDESSLGILPPAQDEVQVMQLSRARSGRCAVQIIVGMTDVWLPTTHADKTVFMQEEKQWLEKNGVHLPSNEERIIEDEALSLYECMAKPKEKLILSYPLSDQAHKPMNESIFIRRTKELLPNLEEKSLLADFPSVRGYLDWESLKYTMDWMRRYGKLETLSDAQMHHCQEIMSYYAYFKEERPHLTEFLNRGLHYHNLRNNLSPSVARKIYSSIEKDTISISELETWQKCPYQHFVKYGIRPEEDIDYTLRADETGTVLHDSLSRLTKDVIAHPEWLSLSDEEIFAQMDQYLEEGSQRYVESQRLVEGQNKVIMKRLQRQTRTAGKFILKQLGESRFQPKFYEAKFGTDGIFPPIVLEYADGECVLLEGRIDRVDVWRHQAKDYVRVIDYKSGNKAFNLSDAFAGLDMQLLLYLRAVLGLTDRFMPAGIFYLSMKDTFIQTDTIETEKIEEEFVKHLLMDGVFIDDPDVVEALDKSAKAGVHSVIRTAGNSKKNPDNKVSEQAFSELLEHTVQIALQTVQAVLAGNIQVHPAKQSCDYCTYQGACQFEENRNGNLLRATEKMSWKTFKENFGKEGK